MLQKYGSYLNRYFENESPFVNKKIYYLLPLSTSIKCQSTLKKNTNKKEILPSILTTRLERFNRRQELYNQILQECTEREDIKIQEQ